MFFDPNESVTSPEDCSRLSQYESVYSPFAELLPYSIVSNDSVAMISPDHCVMDKFRFFRGEMNALLPRVLTYDTFLPSLVFSLDWILVHFNTLLSWTMLAL